MEDQQYKVVDCLIETAECSGAKRVRTERSLVPSVQENSMLPTDTFNMRPRLYNIDTDTCRGIRFCRNGVAKLEQWTETVYPPHFHQLNITAIKTEHYKQSVVNEHTFMVRMRMPPSFPDTLKVLCIDVYVPNIPALPPGLEVLKLIYYRCEPGVLLPPGLRELDVHKFIADLTQTLLPKTLCILKINHLSDGIIPMLPTDLVELSLPNYTGPLPQYLPPGIKKLKLDSYNLELPPRLPETLEELCIPSYKGKIPDLNSRKLSYIVIQARIFADEKQRVPGQVIKSLRVLDKYYSVDTQMLITEQISLEKTKPVKKSSDVIRMNSIYDNWDVCAYYLSMFPGVSTGYGGEVTVEVCCASLPCDFEKLLPIKSLRAHGIPTCRLPTLPDSITSIVLLKSDSKCHTESCVHCNSISECDQHDKIPSVLPAALESLEINKVSYDLADVRESRMRGEPDPSPYNRWALCKKYLAEFYINAESDVVGQVQLTKWSRVPNDFDRLPITHISSKFYFGNISVLPSKLEVLILDNFFPYRHPRNMNSERVRFPSVLPNTLRELRLKKYHNSELPGLPSGLTLLETQDGFYDTQALLKLGLELSNTLRELRLKQCGNTELPDLPSGVTVLETQAQASSNDTGHSITMNWETCADFLSQYSGLCPGKDGSLVITEAETVLFPANFHELPIVEITSDTFDGELPTLPRTLRRLVLKEYNGKSIENLPNGLQYLDLALFDGEIIGDIPMSLEYLSLGSFTGELQMYYHYTICEIYMPKYNQGFEIFKAASALKILHLESFNNKLPSSRPVPSSLERLVIPSFTGGLPDLRENTKLKFMHTASGKYSAADIKAIRKVQNNPNLPNGGVANVDRRVRENAVAEYLTENFENMCKCEREKVFRNACTFRRPDFYCELDGCVLIIEIDEDQHRKYDIIDENKRMIEIYRNTDIHCSTSKQSKFDPPQKPVVFIRFNPDGYTDGDGQVFSSCWIRSRRGGDLPVLAKEKEGEWKERLNTLGDTIRYFIMQPRTEETPYIRIVRLFFDKN